jgi:putative tricarboxylic transport membrane protein
MNMQRKRFLQCAAAGALLPLSGASRAAENGETKPSFRVLIPANAGGGWDLTGRAIGQALVASGAATDVRYENRGGAAGTIGLAQFAKGYRGDPNALMVMGSVMLGGIITGNPPVGLDQVRPLARLTNEYNVFVLPPNSSFKGMAEVLRQFRNDPGSIKWGGGSRGSTEHIAVHMIAKAMDVPPNRINYVPFRGGGEAAAAVMGGYLSVGGSGFSEFLPHIASGRMRAVAVTSSARLPGTEAPTLTELGAEVVIGNWRGVCAPGGLPAADFKALVGAIQSAMRSADWQRSVKNNQWLPEPMVGAPFEAFVAREFDSLRSVLLKAGLA